MANCKHCGQKAGFLRSAHGQCKTAHEHGWQEIVAAAAQAADGPTFSQTQLHLELLDIAKRSFYGDGTTPPSPLSHRGRPSTTIGIRKSLLESAAVAAPVIPAKAGIQQPIASTISQPQPAYRPINPSIRDNEVTTSDCAG